MLLYAALVLSFQGAQRVTPSVGSGSVSGVVRDTESGRPVAGASVSLRSIAPGSGRTIGATTGADGVFKFQDLAAGEFLLSAAAAGYVEAAYGAINPIAGGAVPIAIAGAASVGPLSIRMSQSASLSGIVADEKGVPVRGVSVRAFQSVLLAGERRFRRAPRPPAITTESGVYSIRGLIPGTYVVAVDSVQVSSSANDSVGLRALAQDLNLPVGSAAGVIVAPGRLLMSTGVPGAEVRPDGSSWVFPLTFCPSGQSAASAHVTLSSGENRSGIDCQLRRVRSYSARGVLDIADPTVERERWPIHLSPVDVATDFVGLDQLQVALTLPTNVGDFAFDGIPPGDYLAWIRKASRPQMPLTAAGIRQTVVDGTRVLTAVTTGGSEVPMPLFGDQLLWSRTMVSVDERAEGHAVMQIRRGVHVSGRVTFSAAPGAPSPLTIAKPIVIVEASKGSAVGPGNSAAQGYAGDDGQFQSGGFSPGRYIIRVGMLPAGWTVESIQYRGANILERAIDVDVDLEGITVNITQAVNRVSGVVRTPAGDVASEALVVVFPMDRTRWVENGLNPRGIRAAHVNLTGSYSFEGLPAGEYYLAALSTVGQDDWPDPRFLDGVSARATKVVLSVATSLDRALTVGR